MDPGITAALVGAGGAILAAVLTALLSRPPTGTPRPPAPHPGVGPAGTAERPPDGRPPSRPGLVFAVAAMGVGAGLMVMAVAQLSRRSRPTSALDEELYINWAAVAAGLLVVGVITFGLVLRRR